MSNEEILNKRWSYTDKTLKEYLKNFKELEKEVIDNLLEIFNSLDITYNDLNKPISKLQKRKLDRKILEWDKKGLLTGYLAYLIASKTKYTYSDLIEILIYGVYVENEGKVNDLSKEIFTNVSKDVYNQALEEISIKPKKKFSLTWEFIWSLLWIPTYNKNWDSYLQLLTLTNEQEMYKQILIALQQDRELTEDMLKDLIHKQTNRVLSINDDKYSGVLSDTCRQLANKVYTEPFKDEKELQVRFIAEIDSKTTKMCKSMDNMLFFVNDWNKFYRYSELDKKEVLYNIKGLELGINLPPINNHFHWCRSTITYLIDKDVRKRYKDITRKWLKQKKINEHYKVERLDSVFLYDGKEYLIDNHNVKYEFRKGEKEFAEWLSYNSSKRITLLPKINNPEKISTPDYLIDNEYFDYKYTTGSSNQLIYHNLYDKKRQSSNFILEINNDKLSMSDIYEQIDYTYRRLNWVKKIAIKKEDTFIIFER